MLYPVQGVELKQGHHASRDTYVLLTQRIKFLPNLKVKKENADTSSHISLTGIFCDVMSIQLNNRDLNLPRSE